MSAPAATWVAAPPAAVLWDMDGTLVDTEPYWMRCEQELVAEFGGMWSDADARSIIGFDLLEAAAILRDRGGVDLELTDIVERLHAGVLAHVRRRMPWRPGARRLLAELHRQGVPCALVTMSWRLLVDAVLEALQPLTFDAVVTGDEVVSGKPDPEPYLRAAAALRVDPQQCLAIEDSPTGVASAGAAGCVVLAVRHLVDIEPAPGRYVVPTLRDVTPEHLGALIAATPAPNELTRTKPVTSRAPIPGRRLPGTGDRNRRRAGLLAAALALLAVLIVGLIALRGGDDAPQQTGAMEARPAPQTGSLPLHAWAPYWTIEESIEAIETRGDMLLELSPLLYQTTGVDTIELETGATTAEEQAVIDAAREQGVPVIPSIFDRTASGVMAGILADPVQRARHVDAIVAFAADGDFDGLDIDYEQFAFADDRDTWATTRPNWVAFVEELAARLHADERTLTITIPPVYDTGQTEDSGYWVYDYAAITPLVDSIRVMAYDYSNASTDAGAVAPLEWVDRVIAGTSAASGDPSKLMLGVPLYGYNWPIAVTGDCPSTAEGVTTVTNRTVDELAQRRGATPTYDPVTGEWSFQYELVVDDGTTACTQLRQVNYVDADGAQLRMEKAVAADLGGVALFALGYADDAVWSAVDTVAASIPPPSTAPSTSPSTGP